MKIFSSILALNILFLFPSVVFGSVSTNVSAESTGGVSSIKVNVNNNVNVKNDETFVSSDTTTKVLINQTGEGTSSVKINGKEWNLEGPGTISFDESSSGQEPTPTPESDEIETPEPQTETENPEETRSFPEAIFDQIVESIQDFIKSLF
ncbi:MAG: hypothetical protein UT00_C0015G0010 [Parcubacteria group bacterium GW2011_GWA1_38_7]|nr:MAG: hypothetical protein UT00_C0015G0010 [Parcubacteria group bacterium GW2011_GWA1_38_7]